MHDPYIFLYKKKARTNSLSIISYPNSSGDNCFSTCGLLPVMLSCLKPIVTQSVRFRDVSEGNKQKTQNRGWKDQFRGCTSALGPSRPIRKLQHEATSSPGWACCIWTKPPARMGKLGGKLLPNFGYKRAWEAEGKGSTPLASIFHLKLVKRRRKSRLRHFRNVSITFPWPILWTFFAVLRPFFIVHRSSSG